MPPLPELPPPDAHVLPGLATFLCERREHITDLWVEAVRANPRIASTDGLDYQDLADHLPRLFDDLADTLRGQPVDALVARDSEGHGEHRWQQHYSLVEVTRELSVVCRLVLVHGLDAFREEHPEVLKPALAAARDRILDFFEDTTAGSVRQYVRKQNEEREALHERLREADGARAAQAHSERDRLADVFRRSPSFIAVLRGPAHVFELTNDRYDQLVGRRDLLGKPVREVLPELADQGFFELLDQVYATGEPLVGDDVRVLLRSEPDQPPREHFVDFLFQPTHGADGAVDGVFVHGVDWTERKRAEKVLAEASEHRRLALDSARMGWWHLDLLTGQVHMDERFSAIFGFTGGTLSQERVDAAIHPEDLPKVKAAAGAALRPGDPVPYAMEYRVVHAGGLVRWVQAKGQAHFEGEGDARRAVSLVGTVADVTDAKAAADALRESEERFRTLFTSINAGFCEIEVLFDDHDPARAVDYRYLTVNPAFERMTGWADAAGKRVRELVPDHEEHWFEIYGRIARTGEPARFEDRAEGLGRWYEVYAYRVGDPAKHRVAVLFNDVSERRRADAVLRESEERFRQLADAMPQIVWAGRGSDCYVDYYNAQWYEYTGLARDAFGDESWAHLLHPDDLQPVMDVWTPAVAAGRGWEVEFRIKRAADGAYRWFLGRAVPITDAAGKVHRWIGTNTDIHEHKRLLEQNAQLLDSERVARTEAERTSQMKDEFLATLSHELRTPLNAILGWAQVLRGDLSNPEDLAQGLDTIERNARAQHQIIEDLLDMSRIISGKVRLDVQRLDLAAVLTAAVETMRLAADAKHLRLQPVIDPGARWVSGDLGRLQQVFWNLLSNAVKFTPKGGRVQVVLERVNSHLEVRVADSGEGIAPEFLPHVFDRFRQQDASTTRRHGGLGLGLSIVRQLVELHGGRVDAQSAGPGQGTTFRVVLPLRAVQPGGEDAAGADRRPSLTGTEAPAIPPPLPGQLRLRGVKVLVVDDEADARGLVKRLLEDRDARVEVAGSVAEAMERFRAGRPDVLVSDIGMPGEDGYSLIRRVRALSPDRGGDTPALALTAYARSEDRLRAILAGFQMHLAKPVEPLELLAMVASLAGRTGGVER